MLILIILIMKEKKPMKIIKKGNFNAGELIDDNDDDIINNNEIFKQMSDLSGKIVKVTKNQTTEIIKHDVEKNAFPQKPTLNTNKRVLEIPIEETKIEEPSQQPQDTGFRVKKQVIDTTFTINDFYNKYKQRDQSTFKNPKEESSYYQIIPNKENRMNFVNTINQSLIHSQISMEENFDYNNIDNVLKNKNKEELEDLIKNTFDNLNKMSNNNILNHYVNSIKQYVDIDHFDNERKKTNENN